MKGMNRRRAGTLLGLLTASVVAIAGCSSLSHGTTSTKPSTSLTIPTPATGEAGATSLPNPSDWPEQDTPISQASTQLQMAWDPYGVSIIPSRHVFDSIPAVPTVLNETSGALTQAQVQQMGLAFYRTDALWGWADAHDQMKFQLYLSNQGFMNSAPGRAESQGQPVNDPSCDLYPVDLAVVPVDQSVVSFEAGWGYQVSAHYALVERYKGPCSVTASTSSGPQILVSWQWPALILETGTSRTDSVLGWVWFAESARTCPASNMPTPVPGFPTPNYDQAGPSACHALG
jgi:hypothetical protein